MESNENTPNRKRKKPVKDLIINPTEDQIKKLLKETLLENLRDKRKDSDLEIDAMVATVEEFMRSFILIGYNLKNEPVAITHATSQLDADALYTSLARLFISVNQHGGL